MKNPTGELIRHMTDNKWILAFIAIWIATWSEWHLAIVWILIAIILMKK